MDIHPSWYRQFTPERGGAIHEQFVTCLQYHELRHSEEGKFVWSLGYRRAWIEKTNEPVFGLTGTPYFYRTTEFIQMMNKATSLKYHELAKLVEQLTAKPSDP